MRLDILLRLCNLVVNLENEGRSQNTYLANIEMEGKIYVLH